MTTITINRATVEQALEALEKSGCVAFKGLACRCNSTCASYTAAVALRAALAQQVEAVQETCPGCEATLGAACGRESCPKGWEAAPQPQQAEPVLQTCNCRWDGEVQVQQCTLHEAHVDAIHEWAERAKFAERKLAQQAERVEPVAHRVVAGALFDFMGWLTSRRERLVLSGVDNAAPAADAIKDFAEMRGLNIDDALVKEWQDNITAPPQRKPLTDEEIVDAVRDADLDWQAGWTLDEHEPNRFTTLARAVERKVRGEERC